MMNNAIHVLARQRSFELVKLITLLSVEMLVLMLTSVIILTSAPWSLVYTVQGAEDGSVSMTQQKQLAPLESVCESTKAQSHINFYIRNLQMLVKRLSSLF
jgi:hypothetical protein